MLGMMMKKSLLKSMVVRLIHRMEMLVVMVDI
jgi:hypothetical protein